MPSPVITIRNNVSPFQTLSSLNFIQSSLGSKGLPVLQGEASLPVIFRVYNNFALAAGIEDALNVSVTVYDGVGAGSHTASTPPASQCWLHTFENGFGQNSTTFPDLYTKYTGLDTCVGGSNFYIPEKGSNGLYGAPDITGSSGNAGYIELQSYLTPPPDAIGGLYQFAISILYEYI